MNLVSLWDDEFKDYPWIKKGNSFFGKPSANYWAPADDPEAKDRAVFFIRHAIRARAVHEFRKIARDQNEAEEFAEHMSEITENTPKAKSAWERIIEILSEHGPVVGKPIQDIAVNVISEVLKKILGL